MINNLIDLIANAKVGDNLYNDDSFYLTLTDLSFSPTVDNVLDDTAYLNGSRFIRQKYGSATLTATMFLGVDSDDLVVKARTIIDSMFYKRNNITAYPFFNELECFVEVEPKNLTYEVMGVGAVGFKVTATYDVPKGYVMLNQRTIKKYRPYILDLYEQKDVISEFNANNNNITVFNFGTIEVNPLERDCFYEIILDNVSEGDSLFNSTNGSMWVAPKGIKSKKVVIKGTHTYVDGIDVTAKTTGDVLHFNVGDNNIIVNGNTRLTVNLNYMFFS